MKRVILFLTILLPSIIYPQSKYYTFSELNGMEDQSGNTHLFYRMYFLSNNSSFYEMENSIYHLNLKSGTDSLFLGEGIYQDEHQSTFSYISDYKFWNRNSSKYIYCGSWAGGMDITLHAFVKRFDMSYGITIYNTSFSSFLEISRQNDSLVFADIGSSCISTDGGKSWDTLKANFHFISLNPFNDQIMFCSKNGGGLYKSTDQGKNFYLANTGSLDPQKDKMFFYKDDIHVYLLENNSLLVSNNRGELSSWSEIYSGNNSIYVSLDSTKNGDLYLTDGKNIFHSSNYGDSFTLFKKLDQDIVGIYKKPNSDKLYAATKYKLVEISGDSIKTLKSRPINPKILSFFPLKIGDKWIYKERMTVIPEGDMFYSNHVISVIGDTLMSNNINYKIVLDNMNYRFLRTDSTGGVYEYFPYMYPDSVDNETLYQDLIMNTGDTVESNWKNHNGKIIFLSQDSAYTCGVKVNTMNYEFFSGTYQSRYQLAEGLGISIMNIGQDFDFVDDTLKGAVINGVVYGDTTVTGIKGQKNIPLQFTLFQNYPNPFNPSTIIKYEISKAANVKIKVYDVLGREIATLLNSTQKAGQHEVEWNAKNYASGIYFYRIRAGEFVSTKKMLLIK